MGWDGSSNTMFASQQPWIWKRPFFCLCKSFLPEHQFPFCYLSRTLSQQEHMIPSKFKWMTWQKRKLSDFLCVEFDFCQKKYLPPSYKNNEMNGQIQFRLKACAGSNLLSDKSNPLNVPKCNQLYYNSGWRLAEAVRHLQSVGDLCSD